MELKRISHAVTPYELQEELVNYRPQNKSSTEKDFNRETYILFPIRNWLLQQLANEKLSSREILFAPMDFYSNNLF